MRTSFDAGVPTVPVSSGSFREAHGFRRLVLVSNTVDVSAFHEG